MAAAMLISCLQGKSFDDSIAHIWKLRNIEPWKIVGPLCDRDLVDWVHSVANGRTLPDSILRVPAELVCGFRRLPLAYGSSYVFAMSDDKPYPACKWRQSGGHAKSVHEALVYDRPFCSACYH